jgi:hypothetical protein
MQQLLKARLAYLKTRMYIKGYRNIYIRWKNQFILRARISGGGPTPTGRRLRQKG